MGAWATHFRLCLAVPIHGYLLRSNHRIFYQMDTASHRKAFETVLRYRELASPTIRKNIKYASSTPGVTCLFFAYEDKTGINFMCPGNWSTALAWLRQRKIPKESWFWEESVSGIGRFGKTSNYVANRKFVNLEANVGVRPASQALEAAAPEADPLEELPAAPVEESAGRSVEPSATPAQPSSANRFKRIYLVPIILLAIGLVWAGQWLTSGTPDEAASTAMGEAVDSDDRHPADSSARESGREEPAAEAGDRQVLETVQTGGDEDAVSNQSSPANRVSALPRPTVFDLKFARFQLLSDVEKAAHLREIDHTLSEIGLGPHGIDFYRRYLGQLGFESGNEPVFYLCGVAASVEASGAPSLAQVFEGDHLGDFQRNLKRVRSLLETESVTRKPGEPQRGATP